MRLLLLCNSRLWGGAEKYVVTVARGLAARGHTCFVGAPPGSPTFEAVAAEAQLGGIPFDLGPKLSRRSALDVALHWRAYRRIVREFLESVVPARDIDIVHVQFKKEQLLATPAAAEMGLPVVWTEHGPLPRLFALAPLALRRYRRAARGARRILCVSRHVHIDLAAHGVTGAGIQVCHNGIQVPARPGPRERMQARLALGLEPHHFAVGCTGRLVRIKGQRYLLEAAARARPRIAGLRLVLVGEGPERASLELLAHQLDLAGITMFPGMRDDAEALLPAFDVYASPSLSEGLPLAVLEAMAAERPVIGTRVGGTPEALADGAAGVLIEPGQAGPLAGALERLFHEPRLRGELGTVARKRVIERFSVEGMIEATEAAFLAAGGPVARPTVAVAS